MKKLIFILAVLSNVVYGLAMYTTPQGLGIIDHTMRDTDQDTSSAQRPKRIEAWVPVRPITHGPEYHWFGYYDKWELDPSNRYVLGMQVDFQDRAPQKDDVIKIGMVDLQDSDQWIELGESRAWNWQQGCMLQWLPGSDSKVIWNDRQGDRFVSYILDVKSKEKLTIPYPVYAISPDGNYAITTDFERIQDMRPGYGYPGISDSNQKKLAPKNAGIYRIDLETMKRELIISYADMLKIPHRGGDVSKNKHYFNHLLFSPDGTRFIFLNRWRINEFRHTNPNTPFDTRMMTANLDGSDIRIVDDYGWTSHFNWRDPSHILAWARHPSHGDRFYLYTDDGSVNPEAVGPDVMTRNGHCTYLPGNEWILNDTYPDENRMQHVYLYHVKTGKVVPLANVFLPPKYKFDSQLRVDTHPRISRDGRFVVIDSPHDGDGRQLYLLDISEIIKY